MNESRKRHILDGYGHLTREAIRLRADNIRDELYPDYYTSVHGIIISCNDVRLILNKVDVKLHNIILRENFYFTSSTVYQSLLENSILCSSCE